MPPPPDRIAEYNTAVAVDAEVVSFPSARMLDIVALESAVPAPTLVKTDIGTTATGMPAAGEPSGKWMIPESSPVEPAGKPPL